MTKENLIALYRRFRLEVWVFLIVLIVTSQIVQPYELDNVDSRYYAVSSVVNRGTFAIDHFKGATIDASVFDGHTYSNKGVGSVLVGVPIYWVVRNWTPAGFGPELNLWEMYWVRLFAATLPFCLGVAVLCWLIRTRTESNRQALFWSMAYAFGTICFTQASSFSGHAFSASMMVFGVWASSLATREAGAKGDLFVAFVAGGCFGLAAITEYLAMVIAAIWTVYMLWQKVGWRRLLAFLCGGGFCVVVLAAYNWICFGSPLTTPYSHLDNELFRAETARGFMGIGLPDPTVAWHLLGSPGRGILVISPVLLLGIPGILTMLRDPKRRREGVAYLTVCVVFFALVSGYFGWHGGWGYGPRYLVVLMPFVCLAGSCVRMPKRWRWIPMLLLVASIAQSAIAATGLLMVPDAVANPLIEVIGPISFGDGILALTIWNMVFNAPGLWPWLLIVLSTAGAAVMAWRCVDWTPSTGRVRELQSGWAVVAVVWVLIAVAIVALVRSGNPRDPIFARVIVLEHLLVSGESSTRVGLGPCYDRDAVARQWSKRREALRRFEANP